MAGGHAGAGGARLRPCGLGGRTGTRGAAPAPLRAAAREGWLYRFLLVKNCPGAVPRKGQGQPSCPGKAVQGLRSLRVERARRASGAGSSRPTRLPTASLSWGPLPSRREPWKEQGGLCWWTAK